MYNVDYIIVMYHLSDDTEKCLKLKHMYHCTLNLFSFKAYTPSLARNDVGLELHSTSPPAPFFHIAVFSLYHHLQRDLRKHQARRERVERRASQGGAGQASGGMKRRNSFVILLLEKKVA